MKSILVSIFIFGIISGINAQQNEKLSIIIKPINYNAERVALSLEYLKNRYDIIESKPLINPKIIVLHFTDGGTAKSIFEYFNKVTIENARGFNKDQSNLNVSSHYLIDRDGTIYNLIPDTIFARHVIGLNYCAIGIENIGSRKEPLTDAQVLANAKLVRQLCSQYKIEYVIGHSEYPKFRNSKLWKETNPKYFTEKDDPGAEFLRKVRLLIKDLKVKEKP